MDTQEVAAPATVHLVDDEGERHVRAYHTSIEPAELLSRDRSRRLTPRELVYVTLFPFLQPSPEYVHALVRAYLPEELR